MIVALLVSCQWLGAQQPLPRVERLTEERLDRTFRDLKPGELAPELYEKENVDLGEQRTIGRARRTYFEALVDSQFFDTSNVYLTHSSKTNSTIWVNTVQLALAPAAYAVGPGLLAPRLGFRSQWYNYGLDGTRNNLGELDFNAQTIFVDGIYRWHRLWQFSAGLDATRLLEQGSYDEFYKEFLPHWGVDRFFPLDSKTVLAVGYYGAYHVTEADVSPNSSVNDRLDQAVTLSLGRQLVPRLIAQPFYRFQYTRYMRAPTRNEYWNTVGFSLNYYIARWVSVRAFLNYDIKDTDDRAHAFDYTKLDAGLGLAGIFRF
jgi:hypothetical protein